MEFCCKPLVHYSPRASGNRGKFAWTAQVYDFGGAGFPDSPNTKGVAATGISGLSTDGSSIKIQDSKKPPSQIPNPPNAIGCPPLVFRGFKIQIPINFTMRPSHVQGKQPHLQKAWFLEIWPCAGEKENSPKPTEWMEAWWMGFSFWLSIYHSWIFLISLGIWVNPSALWNQKNFQRPVLPLFALLHASTSPAMRFATKASRAMSLQERY